MLKRKPSLLISSHFCYVLPYTTPVPSSTQKYPKAQAQYSETSIRWWSLEQLLFDVVRVLKRKGSGPLKCLQNLIDLVHSGGRYIQYLFVKEWQS